MARRIRSVIRVAKQVNRGRRQYLKYLKKNRKKIGRVKKHIRTGARYAQKGLSYGAKAAAASGHPELAAGLLVARSGVRSLRRLDKRSQKMRKRIPKKIRQYIP